MKSSHPEILEFILLYFVANGTETIAAPQDDGTYRLYGYKWFSSATDADMTLTLARVQNPDGSTIPVSHPLLIHSCTRMLL